MSKATKRRKKRRRASYLAGLAKRNPERFSAEWAKRLRSWSTEAALRVEQSAPAPGNATAGGARAPRAFALVEEAMALLAGCGPAALAQEGEATREILTHMCSRAVSRAADPRMYRLSNSRSNRRRMTTHAFKLPR